MEDGIVLKEEPMSGGDQVIGEVVVIKQEVLSEDEPVKEDDGNCRRVKDEAMGYPMFKQEGLIGDEHVTEDDGNCSRVEVLGCPMIEQKMLIGDEHIQEEVGNCGRVEDEVVGYPMIEQEHQSTPDSLGDVSVDLQGSVGVHRASEAGTSM
ncbi:hypothetical protein GE061_008237 [Apolygus lucorum]|uniref:Uncharacterized protein n=1 Tax=Apolygus lucorum TaxID=248454 RepID=A0A8S9WQN1_APOLU|nr:hypothetical protein GE061_008237 [Apolygus lucorum]